MLLKIKENLFLKERICKKNKSKPNHKNEKLEQEDLLKECQILQF